MKAAFKAFVRRKVLAVLRPELDETVRTNAAFSERILKLEDDFTRTLLRQRALLFDRTDDPGGGHAPTPTRTISLDQAFEELRNAAPQAFALWHEALSIGAKAYDGFPTDSCSVEGHEMAEFFRAFLLPHRRGPVLDIGCGPQPTPSYLAGYPVERIAGLDPLDARHPFVFHRGFSEFLPWEDGSFETVVAATSLDHVLLLDRSLREIHRVLKTQGRFVAWVAFSPGAARYDPYSPAVRKIDDFHLFHFDRPWFEEVMGALFETVEMLHFPQAGLSSFYCFRSKPLDGRKS